MAVALSEVELALVDFGLNREHETKKKVLFVHSTTGEAVYVNRDPGRRVPGLVIHPRHDSLRAILELICGVSEGSWYHSRQHAQVSHADA